MKSNKRQQAMKRDKNKRRIIAAVCFLAIVVAAAVFAINRINQRDNRVYVNGRNMVTLYADGTFRASLPHDVVRSGTFLENDTGGITTVAFLENGVTVRGVINGNVLTIPEEWDDEHFHPRNYVLRSAGGSSRLLQEEFYNSPGVATQPPTQANTYSPTQPLPPVEVFDFPDDDSIIVIEEDLFANQVFELLMLHERYLGRTVQLEGMFSTSYWEGESFHLVYRWTVSCCGERMVGMEVVLEDTEPFPDNTWVKVVGILATDGDFVVLNAISITETEPGQEVVPSW